MLSRSAAHWFITSKLFFFVLPQNHALRSKRSSEEHLHSVSQLKTISLNPESDAHIFHHTSMWWNLNWVEFHCDQNLWFSVSLARLLSADWHFSVPTGCTSSRLRCHIGPLGYSRLKWVSGSHECFRFSLFSSSWNELENLKDTKGGSRARPGSSVYQRVAQTDTTQLDFIGPYTV